MGVYVTRYYSDFSQSAVEAHPTFGLLKTQYGVRSTDAQKMFTPSHEPVVGQGVLGLSFDGDTATKGCQRVTPSIWRVSKHGGVPPEFGILKVLVIG